MGVTVSLSTGKSKMMDEKHGRQFHPQDAPSSRVMVD
jgi:hypothetical protein